MVNDKKEAFIAELEGIYGKYIYDSALFGSSNFSKIAFDLCYSNSHFTKLIAGSASEAMYERAIKNLEGLKKIQELKHTVAKQNRFRSKIWLRSLVAIILGLLGILAFTLFFNQKSNDKGDLKDLNAHPLDVYFKVNDVNYYKSPYLNGEQVHDYCPGSAFEGEWILEENYVIPIPYKIPGLYYVGKSADIHLKCKKSGSKENRGKELIGFENIRNEIWFDTSLTPVDSKYFNPKTGEFTTEFQNINFDDNDNFVKIASVYSCFFDEILITKDSIYRSGEPCGRYANSENEEILKKYNLDLNHIIEYVIGNMTFAKCKPTKNEFCNPNDVINGVSKLEFDCKCSIKTENLGLGGSYPYKKSIKLNVQNYQSNLLCTCE